MPTYPHGYTFFSEMYQPKKILIANSNNVLLIGEEFFVPQKQVVLKLNSFSCKGSAKGVLNIMHT